MKALTLLDLDLEYWPMVSEVAVYDFAALDESIALGKTAAFEVALIQAVFAATGALEEF